MRTMTSLFTVQDWKRLPEGFPAQLLDGGLVREAAPTYGHQDLVGRLYLRLVEVVDRRLVVLSPADVVIDRLNVLQPDLCVLRKAPALDDHDVGIPRIAFEVLSPTTRARDRKVETLKLLAAGVEEVWLVDPETATLSVCTVRGLEDHRGKDVAHSRALPALRLIPHDLFTDEGACDEGA